MFRRRRWASGQGTGASPGASPGVPPRVQGDVAEPEAGTGLPPGRPEPGGTPGIPADRPDGPWDETEPVPEMPRWDLGALRVPATPELDVELDVLGEEIVAVTVTYEGSAVQLQAFAAPKSGGLWDEARGEIASELAGNGSRVTEVEGSFGSELHTELPGRPGEPGGAGQPTRFVGADGPRWLLRGVFVGSAGSDSKHVALLERVFRGTIVVRGEAPMPPRERLALRLPEELARSTGAPESGSGGSAAGE